MPARRRNRRILIVKLGAAGDVVRTTPLLRALRADEVHWLTSVENAPLIGGPTVRIATSIDELVRPGRRFDLIVCLEESVDLLSELAARVPYARWIGARPVAAGVTYTREFAPWFDMGLIGRWSLAEADRRKFANRLSYQQHLFAGMGLAFSGERYVLPRLAAGSAALRGDIAIAADPGPRWPMKRWAHYGACAEVLARRHTVNFLPLRAHLHHHMADIAGHRVVLAADAGLGNPPAPR